MNMRASGTAALLAAAALAGGLLTGAQAAVAARPAGTAGTAEAATSPGTITTVAGGLGRGLPVQVFQTPYDLAVGPGGALYVGGGTLVREFSSAEYSENVIAGTGGPGFGLFGPAFGGDGKSALHSAFSDVSGLAVDGSGNVLIADRNNNMIRVVAHSTGTFYGAAMKAGYVYGLAGATEAGFSGDGGPATSASLDSPAAVAVDAGGNVLIADTGNLRIRVVAHSTGTFYGVAMTAGDIYTVAGDGTAGVTGNGIPATTAAISPSSVTTDAAGNIVLNSVGVVRVVAVQTGTFYGQSMTAGDIYTVAGTGTEGYSGDGGPAIAAELDGPSDVAVDPAGNLAIADHGDGRVRLVAVQTGTFYGQSMTAGDIYTVAGDGIAGPARSGGLATSTSLSEPNAVAFDEAGNLVVAVPGYDRVFVVAATAGRFYNRAMTANHIYIVAGDNTLGFSGSGGQATNAEIDSCCTPPSNLAADGRNYVVLGSNQAWFVANTAGTYFGRAMAAGHAYVVAGTGFDRYAGDGGLATSARFTHPAGVAVDSAGNLIIADTGNKRVRVVAATTGTFYGQAMTADHVYTVAGNGTRGYSGDGGPATAAELKTPAGVAVDGAGNLVIADTAANRIRVVAAATGMIYGKKMTAGDIYTVAGTGTYGFTGNSGPATKARLAFPEAVAVDGAGNLVITDTNNHQVRVVAGTTGTFYGVAMTAGDIYTVAGTGTAGGSGDGGPATAAELWAPEAVAVDGSGNLVIADNGNDSVRVVAASSGTFYGVAMTAGDIYLVAGDGRVGFSGDGGPATGADLNSPEGVAVDGAGNLVIDDTGNFRIRVVTG